MVKIGIIGGSGLDDPNLLENYEELDVETPYGRPSSPLTSGKLFGVDVFIISRHGKSHQIPPSEVNNRANIYALSQAGCTHIIATTAAGSLREEIGRGDFVVLDQLIDFTKQRKETFFTYFNAEPKHTAMADPFSQFLRKKLIESCEELGIKMHPKGTVITIEGPRFSTRAESRMFRAFGADVINMSIAPEAILANEQKIQYAAIAMSTDYDCWKEDEEPVTWENILKIFQENVEKMKKVLVRAIEIIGHNNEEFIKNKIRTIPNWPKQGIMFRDITTLLKDAEGFEKTLNVLEQRYKDKEIDIIAGIESRGFVIASALASRLKKGLVLIRKPGKLPSQSVREEYELEYGRDAVEIHADAIERGQRVLLVDDLLATGGTCCAAANLIEKINGKVVECAFIIELPELKGRKKLSWPVFSIVEFEGD